MLIEWTQLPTNMKNDKVKYYYDILSKKRFSLYVKRGFDILISCIMLIVLSWLFLIIAIIIKLDSPGKIIYKQKRVTQYGKYFFIYKFRTMVENAEELGGQITTEKDDRITKTGTFLRKFRLDEVPQLINILKGDMTFVGTRPEIPKFVDFYSDEMLATLLLPAGVTGEACIQYIGQEQEDLEKAEDVDKAYVEIMLPKKMKYNLLQLENFGIKQELNLLYRTIIAVLR